MINTHEDIVDYHRKNSEEVCDLIINHFHETSRKLDELKLSEELMDQLGHAQIGSYLKATSNSFAGFVSLLTDRVDDDTYKKMKEEFMGMISKVLDKSYEMTKQVGRDKPDAN